MNGELKLREEFFQRLRRTSFWVTSLLVLAAAGMGLFVSWRQGASPGLLLGMGLLAMGLVAFGGRKGMRAQIERYRSYTIVVGEDALERRMEGFPPVRLALAEITRGVRIPGRGLTLYAQGPRPALYLPAALEDFEALAAWLERGKTFEVRPARRWRMGLVFLAMLLPTAALAVTLTATSRAVILACGIPAILILAASLFLTVSSPQLDRRTRRQMWWVLLPLLALGVKVWGALRP